MPHIPSSQTSRIRNNIKEWLSRGMYKADLAVYNQKMKLKIILESATLSKERKVIWKKFNEFLFSFSPEKVEYLGNPDYE